MVGSVSIYRALFRCSRPLSPLLSACISLCFVSHYILYLSCLSSLHLVYSLSIHNILYYHHIYIYYMLYSSTPPLSPSLYLVLATMSIPYILYHHYILYIYIVSILYFVSYLSLYPILLYIVFIIIFLSFSPSPLVLLLSIPILFTT